MKHKIRLWQIWGFAFTSLLGTLLHFLYEWCGGAVWIAPFSGINESTWEHMKLIFWPMLVFAVIEGFFFRDRGDFACIKCRGILIGLTLIPVLFYTYNGAVGKSPDWLNISIFFISTAVAYIYEARRLLGEDDERCDRIIPTITLIAIATLFVIFTFLPPDLPIFISAPN